jgi:hypothetical protein
MNDSDPKFNNLIDRLEVLKSGLERELEIQSIQRSLEEQAKSRLAENLELFKINFPNIYRRYADYKPAGKYKLVCNDNGEPNLLVVESGGCIYGKSPFDDCLQSVEEFMKNQSPFLVMKADSAERDSIGQLHLYIRNKICEEVAHICSASSDMRQYDSVPTMFMFGLGLGFQLGYLYERMTPLNLFIVEPDEELFYYSLCVFDYTSLLDYLKRENLGINFYLHTDSEEFVHNVNSYLIDHAGSTLPELAMFVYNSDIMQSFVEKARRDFGTLVHISGFFDDMIFGICHSMDHILNNIPVLRNCMLPKSIAEKPVVVVGNGPSLDDDIDLLERYQDRFFIIACGTAFSALCRRNIRSDIYVAVERTLDVYESLVSISDHREFFDETLCMAVDVVHPKVFALFKHNIMILKGNELMPVWLFANKLADFKVNLITRVNPLVSNLGLELASTLGFENVYLLGLDNGSAGESTHSRYSLYYDDDRNLKDQYKNMVLDEMPLEMPGNFVPTVRTNMLFKLAVRIMEQTISAYENQTEYCNCSNGMKIEKCRPLHFGEINWAEMPLLDKQALRRTLLNAGTVHIDLDINTAKNRFQISNFKSMLDQIYNDWNEKPSTRAEFILRETCHSGYLNEVSANGLVGAKAVQSSLAMLFNYVNKILYHFQDEKKSIDLAHRILRKYTRKLFAGCKVIYEHTFEYELGKHIEVYNQIIEELDRQQSDELKISNNDQPQI